MTGTFTLTGRILDKSKQPVARARLVLAGNPLVLRDPDDNEVYAPPPRVTTDDDGYLCAAVDNNWTPAAEPDVELVVGVQYTLRGVSPQLLGRLVFTAPAEGSTRDIADLISEPPIADPSWFDLVAALDARVDDLEAGPGGGSTVTVDADGTVTVDATTVELATDAQLLAHTSDTANPHSVTKTQVGLANVDNTSDVSKPVSTAQAAADTAIGTAAATDATTKANAAQAAATSTAATDATTKVATETSRATTAEALLAPKASPTFTGTVSGVTKAHVGLNNVPNVDTTDASNITTGTLPTAVLPPLAINETTVVGSQAAMLALTAQRGDMAIRTDTGKTMVLSTDSPSTLADWKEVLAAGQVQSVNGQTGAVSLAKGDVGLGNVDNTSDASKPVSTATQTALDLKAPLASPTFTGTVAGVTKSHVGLGNVDNTSDASKPVSTAAQTALDLKAPLASPTFTGTVAGVTKSHVGLGSVDNTADTAKPVSTAQQTALDLKANLASPTFTGDPKAPTPSAADNDTSIATTAFVASEAVLKATVTTKGDILAATGSAVVARRGVGSNGQVLTADSAQSDGIKWATPSGGGFVAPITPRVGEYGTSIGGAPSGNVSIPTAGTIVGFAVPLAAATYDAILLEVNVAATAGSFLRLGIYDGDTLLGDFGTVTASSNAVKTATGTSVVISTPKVYIVAVVLQTVLTTLAGIVKRDTNAGWAPVFAGGTNSSPGGSFNYSGQETGALPSDLSGKTRTVFNYGAAILVRRSA